MVPAMQRFSARASAALLCGATLALGSAPGCSATPDPRTARTTRPVKTKAAPAAVKTQGPTYLPAHTVASLEGENAIAVFARREREGLLLTSSHGRWQTRLVGAD